MRRPFRPHRIAASASASVSTPTISISPIFAFFGALALGTTARRKEWESAGFGLKEVVYCRWTDAGFHSEGYELAAIHWQRGYRGDVHFKALITEPGLPDLV